MARYWAAAGADSEPIGFREIPMADLADIYWQSADRQFKALRQHLPDGMKALGGVGNGLLEISEDLVAFNISHIASR